MNQKNSSDNNLILITKEEKILNNALRQLGFKLSNIGTKYIKKIVIMAYYENIEYINLETLCFKLAQYNNIKKSSKIVSNIRYSIDNYNSSLAKTNFEKIFGFEYTKDIFTSKCFIEELLNYLRENIQ